MNCFSRCILCKKEAKNIKELEEHFFDHESSETSRFFCHLCEVIFLKLSSLKKHLNHVHNKSFINKTHELEYVVQENECSNEESSDFEETLFDHHDILFDAKLKNVDTIKCHTEGCQITFDNRTSFIMHEKCAHKEWRSYLCHLCSKSFKTSSHLNVHMKMHKNQREHHCHICHKSFFTSSHLKSHFNIHTKKISYKCDVPECEKSFIHLSSFKKHQNFHKCLKEHSCNICHRNFSQLCHLREHQKIHLDEHKQHVCHCSKSFRRLSSLRIHQKLHLQ